jgi:hypothetical protein
MELRTREQGRACPVGSAVTSHGPLDTMRLSPFQMHPQEFKPISSDLPAANLKMNMSREKKNTEGAQAATKSRMEK